MVILVFQQAEHVSKFLWPTVPSDSGILMRRRLDVAAWCHRIPEVFREKQQNGNGRAGHAETIVVSSWWLL